MRSILPVALILLGLTAGPARGATPPPGTGDVNGDRVADVLIVGDADPRGRPGAGSARVVFGRRGAQRSLERSRGFRILGARSGDSLAGDGAYMRAIAGDVNGDGLDDVVLGAEASPQARKGAGAAYVVFGRRGRGTVDLARLGSAGIEIHGPSAGAALHSVAGAGDLDGDGLDDVIVGAYGVDGPGTIGAGAAWVISGRRAGGVVDLADPEAAFLRIDGAPTGDQKACDEDFWLSGDAGPQPHCDDNAGWSVAGVGDSNGDAIPDLAVDAARPSVVFGRRTGGTISLGALGTAGYRIEGLTVTVHSVAAAGDVNGDGLADLTVSDSANGHENADLVFGSRQAAGFDYRSPGDRALRLVGDSVDAVAGAGDVNGDGRDDLVTAGLTGNTGTAWIAFGARQPGRMRLGAAGWRGVRISGRRQRNSAVIPDADPVGDVNGDGRADVLFTDTDGRPYVVLGARGNAHLESTRLGARGLKIR